MATKKKKYYAVRVGRTEGILDTWEACEASIKGYPGAVYKSFLKLEDAETYLQSGADGIITKKQSKTVQNNDKDLKNVTISFPLSPKEVVAYVDGSYQAGIDTYAFGCVFLLFEGTMHGVCGNGKNPEAAALRNVTGEMQGAMFAVQSAIRDGYKVIDICYDYAGIEQWVTGGWKTNRELTRIYAETMNRWGKQIQIRFHKVEAHSNQEFNDLADQMAKRGITEANGTPEFKSIKEYELIDRNLTSF